MTIFCGFLLLVSLGCHKHRTLQNRVKQLDERVTLLELRRSETESQLRKVTEVKEALEDQLAASNQHNQKLQTELTALRTQTQQLKEEIQALQTRLEKLEQVRAARAEQREKQPKPSSKSAKPSATPNTKNRNRGVIRAYRAAIKLMQEGKNEAAAETLETIAKDHANHILAPNAHYWLGEIDYDKREYGSAIQAFQRVLDKYPTSDKAPDALLKIGKSQERQNQLEEARTTYQSVIDRFPKSRAAKLAQSWLE